MYTDDDPFIRNIRRIIGLNGVNVAAVQPDLLERCILIELLPVGKNERKSEEDIWKEFETDRSKIFGGMLDLFARAIAIKPTIVVNAKLRMADFAIWGEAIAQEMGFTAGHFTKIYEQNMAEINDQGIESDYVAAAIRELVEAELGRMRNSGLVSWPDMIDIWSGKPSDFITELEMIAKNCRIITNEHDKYWPGQANAMSRHLNRIKPTLKNEGIIVTTGKRTGSGRMITIVYKNPNNENQSESGQNETGDNPNSRYDDDDEEIWPEDIYPF